MNIIRNYPQRVLGCFIIILLLAFEGGLNYFPHSWLQALIALGLFFFPAFAFTQALLGRGGNGWERLVLTFSLPPVLYTLALYILTFYFHRPFWPSLHFLMVAFPLLSCFYLFFADKKFQGQLDLNLDDPLFFLFLGLILFLALVPQVYPHLLIGGQGSYYSSVSYLIQNDIIPPRNPILYNASVATYWLYFFYLSIICVLTGFSPPQASAFSNIFCLLLFLLIFYAIARQLYERRQARWAVSLIALWGVNIWGYLFFLGRTAKEVGTHQGVIAAFLANLDFEKILPPYVETPRSMGLYHKYLFYNGFPLGFLYQALMLWSALLLLSGKKKKALVFSTLGALGALAFHPPTAFFHLAFICSALGLLWLYGRIKKCNLSPLLGLYILVPFMVMMVSCLPYLREIMAARPERLIVFGSGTLDFLMQFMLLFPILPIFFWGTWNAWKKVKIPELFFSAYAFLALSAAIFIQLHYKNNYKFTYLAAVGMAVVSGSFLEETRKNILRQGIIGALLLSGILNIILIDLSLSRIPKIDSKFISHQGLVLFKNPREPLSLASEWIRENTDKYSVFVKYPLYHERGMLILPMVAQRALYVTDHHFFAVTVKGFSEKKAESDFLFTPQAPGKETVLRQLSKNPEPFYILLEKNYSLADQIYDQLAWEFENPYAAWLEKVYDHEGIKIYRLQKEERK